MNQRHETNPRQATTWQAEYASQTVHQVLGLMSGTSADGIDAAWVQVREEETGRPQVSLQAYRQLPHSADLRRRILRVAEDGRVDEICRLNAELGEAFAEAALGLLAEAGEKPAAIDLIGLHGQTIHHLPPESGRPGSTLQIGEPAVVAERTGIPVVHNFRSRDMALGGQGAPLVPYVDALLLASATLNRAAQNIGGIANVTYLARGAAPQEALAFDTGPGNMVIDAFVRLLTDGAQGFDRDGKWARRGRVRPDLLERWMSHPFISVPPPKSTGREMFGEGFARAEWHWARGQGIEPEDLIATATAWTARSIAENYRSFLGPVDEVILSGGGARNPTLRDALVLELSPARVIISDDLGVPADAKEALAFAVLAHEFARGRPAGLPRVTGARSPALLGCWTPGRDRRS